MEKVFEVESPPEKQSSPEKKKLKKSEEAAPAEWYVRCFSVVFVCVSVSEDSSNLAACETDRCLSSQSGTTFGLGP